MRLNIVVLFCAVLVSIAAAEPGTGPTGAGDVTLEQLSWMAGYWMSDRNGLVSEECWLPPGGGVMLGLHRDNDGEGDTMFEYLRIMETAGGLVYYATPRGYETTKFALTGYRNEDGVYEAVFENPGHDFPGSIRYTLRGNELSVETRGESDGQIVARVWTWTKKPFPDQE